MRNFFRQNIETAVEDDLLDPIRDLRSPLSMERLKAMVFDRAVAPAWGHWVSHSWGFLAEFVAVGAVAGVAYSVFITGTIPNGMVNARRAAASVASNSVFSNDSRASNGAASVVPVQKLIEHRAMLPSTGFPSSIEETNSFSTDRMTKPSVAAISPQENSPTIVSTISSDQVPLHPLPLDEEMLGERDQARQYWSVAASGGADVAHLRAMSETADIHWNDDWQSIGIALMNAEAGRDRHDIAAHQAMTTPIVDNEWNRSVALLVGANIPVGFLRARIEAGPDYFISATNSIVPSTGVKSPMVSAQGIGCSARFSTYYSVTTFLQFGVTGTVNWQPAAWSDGMFASVQYSL